MTYFGFHLRFLLPPILVLACLILRDWRQRKWLPGVLRRRPASLALLIHIALAVVYTTPWDNYLVATRVWWYDPARVSGARLGWVPVEEYLFFVLQTVLTGLWLLWLGRRLADDGGQLPGAPPARRPVLAGIALIWLAAGAILIGGWAPGTYLALELIWLLPPILSQVALGTGVLWHQRRLVSLAVLVPVIYLVAVDAWAIRSGIWSISPDQTTGVLLGGALPLEEFVFFLLTNVLIVFGMTLFMALPGMAARPWKRDKLLPGVGKHEVKTQ